MVETGRIHDENTVETMNTEETRQMHAGDMTDRGDRVETDLVSG